MHFFPVACSARFICCCLALYLCPVSGGAQRLVHRLGVKDGLPDPHVYGTITDRLGYLWLATPKGVVKYNGYNCTVIGVAEGLPTDDNWRLMEDRSGRVWLNNISHELGYLKNDRYHCAARFANPMYPGAMARLGAGIALLSRRYYLSKPDHSCDYIVCDGRQIRSTSLPVAASERLSLNGSADMIVRDRVGSISYRKVNAAGQLCTPAAPLPMLIPPEGYAILFHHFFCTFGWDVPFFNIMPVGTEAPVPRRCSLSSAKERITYAYEVDGYCHVISNKRAYVYDSLFRLSASFSIAELSGGDKTSDRQYCIYNRSPLWGDLLSTSDKGVYRRTQHKPLFQKKELPGLASCRFVGSVRGTGYWWDQERRQLCIVRKSTIAARHSWPGLRKLQLVETLSGETLLLSSGESNFLLRGDSLLPALCLNPLDSLQIKACAVGEDQIIFLLYGGNVPRLVQASCAGSVQIGPVPAKMICYDRYHHGLWLYHNLGLAFYNIAAARLQEIPHAVLQRMGIRMVESVVSDPVYGHVFIKDLDKIWLLSEDCCSVQPVLSGYRHGDARLMIESGRLIVAGRIGLLSLPLLGRGKFGTAEVYENSKDHYYRALSDLQVWGNHALLKTDRGFYELDLDGRGGLADTALVVAQCSDTTRSLNDGDTLLLPAGATAMRLDLIRPSGRGQPAFSYTWEDGRSMKNASNNEVSFEHLKPYRSYRLYLQARDEVWNGKLLALQVWKRPQWWQNHYFISSMIVLGILFCFLIVLLTRKIVLKKQLEKQLMLELSLEATYAKINPHFIFNTLSVAQHHIKAGRTEDAGRYINRFSRLLRSYLKSSRLRYISLEDEVKLLQDYIVLQQERFRNRFSYCINVDERLDLSLQLPTLLLQPFVENAIRHGLLPKEGEGHLSVSFSAAGQGLCIRITDNGIGRRQSAARNRSGDSGSYGNELAERLVRLFNKYEKMKLKIDYADAVPQGTTVVIMIQNLTYATI